MKASILSLVLLAAGLALADAPAGKTDSVGSLAYRWNADDVEKDEALGKTGDIKNGRAVYELCRACHRSSGAGRPDGSFPQLAGQHSSVLIKQMADIRAGRRDNPMMFPFAASLVDPQELADVAAYINSLCIPLDHGRYSGADAAFQVARGQELYEKECINCHGRSGEGDKEKFYPVIAGQHYKYLLRQMMEIRDGNRRNANPDMVEIISRYDNQQLLAISAYQSSLLMPGAMCAASPGKN